MSVSVARWLRRLVSGAALPSDVKLPLDADERVLAWAAVAGCGYLVPTSLGLWVPSPAAEGAAADGGDAADEGAAAGAGTVHRRIGWHLVSRATWDGRALSLVEADEVGTEGDTVLIADRPARRYPMAEPRQVPQVVHSRVTRSVLHSEAAPGGGLRVQRRVPGRDGVQVQIRRSPA